MNRPNLGLLPVLAAVAGLSLAASSALASITIPTVPVGNPGNNSVTYTYDIGATEVTNAQYTAFLTAVAQTDTNNLYSTNMAGSFGGITRSGSPGSYTYSAISGRENHPVNYVSFWDATRFANWLHNGQPTGAQSNTTTENGAYTLTAGGIAANAITRNAGWQWAVTSEPEWYKAAYHQPASLGGDSDDFWLYPNSSNTITTAQANYNNAIGDFTPVGSYAPNFYGTFDMGGNAWEWNESIQGGSSFRGIRGGFFGDPDITLSANFPIDGDPAGQFFNVGFRVVAIPSPSSVALLAIGGVLAGRRRRN